MRGCSALLTWEAQNVSKSSIYHQSDYPLELGPRGIVGPRNASQGNYKSSPANLPTINLTGHNQLIFPSKRELDSSMEKKKKKNPPPKYVDTLKEVEYNPPLKYALYIVTSFQSRQYGKGEKSNFTVEKPDKHYPWQLVKVNINRIDSSHP